MAIENFKTIFNGATAGFTVDEYLIKRLRHFERAFVNYNEHHIAFFGGQLTGPDPMRFTPHHRAIWFDEILNVDEDLIAEQTKKLPHNQDWIRANDVFNQSCVWLIYKIETSSLSPALKEEGKRLTMQIFQYKLLGSLLHNTWHYPADVGVAQATLAAMSRKFMIKTHDSWHHMLKARSEELVSSRSTHRRAFTKMDDDLEVIKFINDVQSRLKKMIIGIAKIFYDLHGRGVSFGVDSSVRDINGQTVLNDKQRQFTSLIRYAHEVLDDKNSFVRDDLIDVVADAVHTMNPKLLVSSLEWMSINRHSKRDKDMITELVDETLIYAFGLIVADRDLYNSRSGLGNIITRLRGLYTASRMSDPVLLRTKEISEKIVVLATGTRNTSMIASVRTGLQLYLVIRAMAMEFYQSQK